MDGTPHWLWVLVNDGVALYVISRSRGSKVPQALLGPDFDGTIISDFFSAYAPLEVSQAKWWAHLWRDSHDLAKGRPPDSEQARFHRELPQLFLEMGLALETIPLDPSQGPDVARDLRAHLLAFTFHGWQAGDVLTLAQRLRTQLDELLVWRLDPAVPATNNEAERALRPAVVARKTSFGSRSKFGALAFARLLSIIHSWERQGKDFFEAAVAALAPACS